MRTFRRFAATVALPLLVCFLTSSLPLAAFAVQTESLSVQDVPTNLGLAHAMAAQVAGATLDELGSGLPGRFYAAPHTEHSGNGIFLLALEQAARDRGYTVSDAQDEFRLEFQIMELRIAYTSVDRVAFWTGKEVERRASCVLAGRLVRSRDDAVLATTQKEVVMGDRFDYELTELLASSNYSFTSPELKERDWSKSTEPYVVTGMIVGLIYLFFSNQSGD